MTRNSKVFCLNGKTAIVTGGGGILGEKFCLGLAEAGAQVVVLDICKNDAERVASAAREKFQGSAVSIECDVSNKASVRNAVLEASNHYGEIHVLHNNAATKTKNLKTFFKPFEEYELDTWREVMSVNLDGMFLMCQEVGKLMRQQKCGGSIIQTASIYGILAPDNRIYEGSEYRNNSINTPAVYSASKAGVIGLTRYLAAYWAPYGIRVNTLTPGGVFSGQNEVFQKNYSNRVPMGRMAEAHEMVGALLFLASDASSYVTGQNIIVDGGLCAW